LLHLHGGGDGVVGILGIGNGGTENGQETIAKIFIDDSPVFEYYLSHDMEKQIEHRHRFSRSDFHRQTGKIAQIDIEHRQHAQLLGNLLIYLDIVHDPVHHFLGYELLEHPPDAPFLLRHGEGLPIQTGIFQGDAHRGSYGLEELHVSGVEFSPSFVEYLNHTQDPPLGHEGHTQD